MKLFNNQAKIKSVTLSIAGGLLFLALNVFLTSVASVKTSNYIVASTKLSPGISLTAKDLESVTIKGAPPQGSYQKDQTGELIGRHLNVGAVANEPIIGAMLADPNKQVYIENVPSGFDAYWVQASIDATGYLSVGDVVSIYDKKGTSIGNGAFRVIGAVDNQGNPIKSGNASAVEIAVPPDIVPILLINSGNVRLISTPWANVTTFEQGSGLQNDQTNVGNPANDSTGATVRSSSTPPKNKPITGVGTKR